MSKKMYVDVNEVCEDWDVSRAQGYKMIKELNDRMKSILIGSFYQEKQTENSTRRIVMEWQKKRKKRPFLGKGKVITSH